ncbi:MAG: hypothetical protein LBH32_02130 [Dysgonamonadaceae bacterium]|jgi:hypothetical protein|nr:hypothetical protein [Dysgonamonadaceae bacterium]
MKLTLNILTVVMETLDGRGVESVLNPFRAMPIYLGGGQAQMLFGEDLAPYFDIDNLVFKGYTKEQYRCSGQLPEGFYRITIEFCHFHTGLISNHGTVMAWFALGKPPVLKLPETGSDLEQGMKYAWRLTASDVMSRTSFEQDSFSNTTTKSIIIFNTALKAWGLFTHENGTYLWTWTSI